MVEEVFVILEIKFVFFFDDKFKDLEVKLYKLDEEMVFFFFNFNKLENKVFFIFYKDVIFVV